MSLVEFLGIEHKDVEEWLYILFCKMFEVSYYIQKEKRKR